MRGRGRLKQLQVLTRACMTAGLLILLYGAGNFDKGVKR
jgi:hypothetical protein